VVVAARIYEKLNNTTSTARPTSSSVVRFMLRPTLPAAARRSYSLTLRVLRV
jgi:hypothetical protein